MSGAAPERIPGGRHRNPSARPAIRGWILGGVVASGALFSAGVVLAYFGLTYGVTTAVVALSVAVIPLGIVVPSFLWLDRYEAEPNRYLVMAFLWGALVAAPVAAVINTAAIDALAAAGDAEAALDVGAVIVAPVVEETLKGLLVVIVWLFLRHEFDGVTDGIVYAGICAAGFAFTENIQYLASAYSSGGTETLTLTFVLRGLLAPFAHPMFTILTGAAIGLAATSRAWSARILLPLGGLGMAMLAHGLWNAASLLSGSGYLVLYVLIEVPVFIAFVVFVALVRRQEGHLIGRMLRPYADAGWYTAAELDMLSSMSKRRQARVWARTNGGRRALNAMRGFQDTSSELALLRRRTTHRAADARAVAQERELLEDVARRRSEFIGTAYV